MPTFVYNAEGAMIANEPDALSEAPATITALQARLALAAHGKLADVADFVEQLGGEAKIVWEYATIIERASPLVLGATAALGMTEAQMDDLFRLGATL